MGVVPSVARCLRRFKEYGDARTPSGSPDHSKTYEVHMGAFWLCDQGHVDARGASHCLSKTEVKWHGKALYNQWKEMTVVVHYLRTWWHYLLGFRYTVKTDNIAISYFRPKRSCSLSRLDGRISWPNLTSLLNIVRKGKPSRRCS